MHVIKQLSIDRTNWFLAKKYKLLRKVIKKPEAQFIFYPKDDFQQMILYFKTVLASKELRIYIASYLEEGSDSVPPGFGNLLTLIFVPIADTDTELAYYTISPYEKFDPKKSELKEKVKNDWIKNYHDNKLLALKDTIDLKDPCNFDKKANEVSDTKSICYETDNIFELTQEMDCQEGTSGIKAYFASYTDKGGNKGKCKNRLIIQFRLTERIGNQDVDFYIDDRDGYGQRPDHGGLTVHDFDTGNLCPPKC